MKKRSITWLIVICVFLLMVIVLPLVIPIPALPGTKTIDQLKDPDSKFIQINGVNVHYKKYGEGKPVIFLLHGFGASTFSWRSVATELTKYGAVVAYDRPGFGLTQRPLPGSWKGTDPYSTQGQIDTMIGLMYAFNVKKAILFGNSAGGQVALAATLQNPDRVQALVLVDAAVYENSPIPEWVKGILRTRQLERIGPLFLRNFGASGEKLIYTAWHDPSKVTAGVLDGYKKPLQAENWDIGLWQFSVAPQITGLDKRLSQLNLPVLVFTGDDDCIVATELSVKLGQQIPGAVFKEFTNCGHVPQEECPDQFLSAFDRFMLETLKGIN